MFQELFFPTVLIQNISSSRFFPVYFNLTSTVFIGFVNSCVNILVILNVNDCACLDSLILMI